MYDTVKKQRDRLSRLIPSHWDAEPGDDHILREMEKAVRRSTGPYPELRGSEKQTAWAKRIRRANLMLFAMEIRVAARRAQTSAGVRKVLRIGREALRILRSKDRATYWIDEGRRNVGYAHYSIIRTARQRLGL